MADTNNNKKPILNKPSDNNKKAYEKEYYGKTIFFNYGFNFNGNKIRSASYINLNNIFYDKDNKYDEMMKGFSESETYLVATEILAKHMASMCINAQEEITKELKKIDKKLKKKGEDKKNIKINLSANLSDSGKGDVDNIKW